MTFSSILVVLMLIGQNFSIFGFYFPFCNKCLIKVKSGQSALFVTCGHLEDYRTRSGCGNQNFQWEDIQYSLQALYIQPA